MCTSDKSFLVLLLMGQTGGTEWRALTCRAQFLPDTACDLSWSFLSTEPGDFPSPSGSATMPCTQ